VVKSVALSKKIPPTGIRKCALRLHCHFPLIPTISVGSVGIRL